MKQNGKAACTGLIAKRVKFWLLGGVLLSAGLEAQTEHFAMGEAMRNAAVESQTEIGHQELVSEGGSLLKNINKLSAGANRTYLENGTEGAWGNLVLEHTVAVQWEGWVEFQSPSSFPAMGMDDKLVIEATLTVETTNPEAGARYNIGLSGRAANSYNNVIFSPNQFATGIRDIAADAGEPLTVRFEIQPAEATGTVFLNDEQVRQIDITGDALTFLTASDLGFVRLYFQSLSASSGADNTPLETTVRYVIDSIRVTQPGGDGGGNGGGGGGDDGTVTSLFEANDGMANPIDPARPEVDHGEFIEQGESVLKNVNQKATEDGLRTLLTEGDAADGYNSIELVHKEAVQWNSWLEYQVPASYPASGANHKVVFETKFHVTSSDTTVNLRHAVGFAARAAGAYSDVMFLPDRLTTPLTPTADLNGTEQVVKFVIEPSLGKGTVLMNDIEVGSLNLTDPALGFLINKDLGFVRLYFKSSGVNGGSDGALLGATQTFVIDYVKAYILGTPEIIEPKVEREYLFLDQAMFNAANPSQPVIPNRGLIRQGENELRFNRGFVGNTAGLNNQTALGYHALEVTQTKVSNGETWIGLEFPFDYPARGREDALIIEVKAGIQKDASLSDVLHGLTLSAKTLSDENAVVFAPGEFGILPRTTTGAHSGTTTYRFSINPVDGTGTVHAGSELLQEFTLLGDRAALLRDHELTDLRLHLHGFRPGTTGSGSLLEGAQTFRVDAIRVFQRATLITVESIKEAFASSGLEGVHPRIFATAEQLDAINSLRQSDPVVSSIFGGVQAAAEFLSAKTGDTYSNPPNPWALDGANLRIPNIHGFHNPVGNLAAAYGLTKNAAYADRIWAQIEMMNTEYPDFGANRHFLDTGVAAANYAIAYDFLFDYLSEDQKTAMWEALRAKALVPAYNQMRSNSWWHTSTQNWNSVVHTGIIMAALAFWEQDPDFNGELIELAANGLIDFIDEFYPNGATEEGAEYWAYGMSYFSMAMHSLFNVLGTDFGLSDNLGIERTRYFPQLISGPVATLNFGDDGIKGKIGQSIYWLASRFDDGSLARQIYESWESGESSGTWRDLLWFDPTDLGDTVTGPEVLESHVRGQDVVSLIETWDDPQAMFIALHGGSNDASHGHLDAGSFYIQAGGTYFGLGNLGPDAYTSPGFFTNQAVPAYNATSGITTQGNQSRWHFYNTRAEGKNALVFKERGIPGDVRPDQDPNGVALVKRIESHDTESLAVLNLNSPYSRDVNHYDRGIRLWEDRRIITVQDEFVPRKDSTVWWSMHTRSPVFVVENGKTARILGSRGNLIARIRSPHDAVFTTMNNLDYLPGESFPQTDNRQIPAGVKKLQIRLEADAGQYEMIRVDFHMDDTAPVMEKWIPWLNEWGTQADWPDIINRADTYAQSSWMGWFTPGPAGWIYSETTQSWLYSLPGNRSDSFYGWSLDRNGWFWTSRFFWPWAYLYTPDGGWLYVNIGAL